jgi:hypothetical protein
MFIRVEEAYRIYLFSWALRSLHISEGIGRLTCFSINTSSIVKVHLLKQKLIAYASPYDI